MVLVRTVMAQQFRLDVPNPADPGTWRDRLSAIDAACGVIARPLRRSETPRAGDVLMMRHMGREHRAAHHIGIWVEGEWVLHHMPALGACLTPQRSLHARALVSTGLYR